MFQWDKVICSEDVQRNILQILHIITSDQNIRPQSAGMFIKISINISLSKYEDFYSIFISFYLSSQTFHGRDHGLVDRYELSISQMAIIIFPFTQIFSVLYQGPSWSYGSQIYNQSTYGAYHHTTNVVSSNPTHGEMYQIQHYVIKFVSDLRQADGFLRFPSPIKLAATIQLKYCSK